MRWLLGLPCYTGSPVSARRATLESPDSTACHFGPSLEQPRVARCTMTMLTDIYWFDPTHQL